jgi:hypothetical protein
MATKSHLVSGARTRRYYLGLLAIGFLILVGAALFESHKVGDEKTTSAEDTRILSSILGNDAADLKDAFVADVKKGVNDKYTKEDAFFITHRFFDNDGDIYEIYDYVNAHPELAFLQEAKDIYPDVFKVISQRDPALTYDQALYADLAYIEVLVNHGYADIAAISTLASQYAKTSYYSAVIAGQTSDKNLATAKSQYVERDAKKAAHFLDLGKDDVAKIVHDEYKSDVTPRDTLVGINQYAAALRYLDAVGMPYASPVSSKEISDFATFYARKNVPELYLYTSYSNASTLIASSTIRREDVTAALYPIYSLDKETVQRINERFSANILKKMLSARTESDKPLTTNNQLGIYSKRNVLKLASVSKEFKMWLMKNGWAESDFTPVQ